MITVFTEFLRPLVASMGVQGGNIFLFVDSCAARVLSMSFVKVVYYPPNCISMLTTSRFGHHMPQAVVQEVPSTKSCVLHALGKVHKTENKFPSSGTFHSSGFAASQMFSSPQLWALTQLTCTPILKVMVTMSSTRTGLG
jgi:hypothetical protein